MEEATMPSVELVMQAGPENAKIAHKSDQTFWIDVFGKSYGPLPVEHLKLDGEIQFDHEVVIVAEDENKRMLIVFDVPERKMMAIEFADEKLTS